MISSSHREVVAGQVLLPHCYGYFLRIYIDSTRVRTADAIDAGLAVGTDTKIIVSFSNMDVYIKVVRFQNIVYILPSFFPSF